MKGILQNAYLIFLLVTCGNPLFGKEFTSDSTKQETGQAYAPSTLTLRMRDKHSKNIFLDNLSYSLKTDKKHLSKPPLRMLLLLPKRQD
jgi:hypothetical protein